MINSYIHLNKFRMGLSLYLSRNWLNFIVPLVVLPAVIPFFLHGLPQSYDAPIHLLRLGALDYQIGHGMWYPRWMPYLLLGHGYPVFNYYSPGAYYIAELFLLFGFNAYYAYVFTFIILILIAGWGMLYWARDIFQSEWSIILATAAYIYTPYLLVNTYIRGSLAEVAAQALLPWVFWSYRRLLYAQQPLQYILPATLSLGALAFSHNITLLFTPVLLSVYAIIIWVQSKRPLSNFYWTIGCFILAMGISAFFWLPLIGERNHLTKTAYEISRYGWLPNNTWTWHNFLDWGLTYTYDFVRPVRLGLIQIVCAILGLFAMQRRTAEIWLLLGIAVIPGVLAGSWMLSIWQSIDILTVVQFPWRLLGIMSPALALLVGGITSRIQVGYQACTVGIITLLIIILAHTPRLGDIDIYSPSSIDLSLANLAQIEHFKGAETGGEETSSVQEFKPKWVDRSLILKPLSSHITPEFDIELLQANAYNKEMKILVKKAGALRFNQFYFPGWQVALDTVQGRISYPSTNLGLLTVDLTEGEYVLSVQWVGTRLQNLASIISILTMIILCLIVWNTLSTRWLVLIPSMILIIGLAVYTQKPTLASVQQPKQEFSRSGIELLAYRYEQQTSEYIHLFPYWHVSKPQPSSLYMHWNLLDDNNNSVVDFRSQPYFNSYRASNWATDSIVDDAYQLPIPPDLESGVYQLALAMGTADETLKSKPIIIGNISIERGSQQQRDASNPLAVRFGESIYLKGYDIKTKEVLPVHHPSITIIQAGIQLQYTLYWQADQPLLQNYHGFIHLVDQQGNPIEQRDQLTGPLFQPSMLWNKYRQSPDVYQLRIPEHTSSGLYWPTVGLYDFENHDRLPVYIPEAININDHVKLPPIKIINSQFSEPMHPIDLRIGDFATLLGYDIDLPTGGLIRAGSTIHIMLYYRSDAITSGDYIRFVHAYNNTLGMAAQSDSSPQKGTNPTWSWMPGEVIYDSVDIQIPLDVKPGDYELLVGFYDPTFNYTRLPLYKRNGDSQIRSDQVLVLMTIQIQD